MRDFTLVKPGNFSIQAAADFKRYEFDMRNETVVANRFNIDFLFIGDSIFNNWEIAPYFAKYGYVAVNRSVGGDTPHYIAKRFEADVLQLKPAYAVVNCGINETWILDDPDSKTKLEQTSEVCHQKIMEPLQDIIARCQTRAQRVFMCSILPIYGADTPSAAMRKELIRRVNDALRSRCDGETAVFIDFHDALTEDDHLTLSRAYSDDGCHPNVYGYNRMADTLLEVLTDRGIMR